MEYLLVFQWPTSTTKDYDLLIMLEEAARAGIGDLGIVDGRDIGSGEMNIFVFTEQVKPALERVKSLPAFCSPPS
jgi:hypothetical protein